MRDERWVDRFIFAWNDTLFFDPLDVYYNPSCDNFISALDEEVKSRFTRNGIWWSYRHGSALPTQGWKIHVSASHRNVHDVATTVIGYLTVHDIAFKIALDINIFETLNSKAMSRGSGGKFITIYPKDDDAFRKCLSDLSHLLREAEGAYVLSDTRYRDCRALYFRYGQFLDTHSVDPMGRKVPYVIGPDGPIADDRRPGGYQPWWQPWPFSEWKPTDGADGSGLIGDRFRVTEAIQFSNSGGIYKAQDVSNGDRFVVLKEARPCTNVNMRQNHDAVDILAREWTFLNRLADIGSFPAPIAAFRQWEHHFIAEEFIDGVDIRAVLLERNPLARPRVLIGIAESQDFLRIFLAVFRGLARAVRAAHDRNVILGDLSAANLLIDPDSYEVVIVDLESCRLAEADEDEAELAGSVELYTPGFSHSRRRSAAAMPEDDLYGLAAIMAYFIFPIAAMSYLREGVLNLYRVFTDGLGWPVRIHEMITDLAQARISLSQLLAALDHEDQLIGDVKAPTRPPIVEQQLRFTKVQAGVAAFVEAAADLDRETLFPVDPFAYVTNPLSLGFGACGVLWALHASGVPIRPEWEHWLQDQVTGLDLAEYPVGLMNGLAGIAWAIDGLGLHAFARRLLDEANQRVAETDDYTFYYGLAGLGMTDLHFYLCGHAECDLAAAQQCARALRQAVQREGEHAYWLNDFAADGPLTGLGFGQAGVALFLLRMYQIVGDDSYLQLGRSALAWEMAHAEPVDGVAMFKDSGTVEPYVEVGSAGVAQVLLRYGDLDAARSVLEGMQFGYSVLPGYAFGMSGVADANLDAAMILDDPSYRDTAVRQLEFVRKVFLFEPAEKFGIPRRNGVVPLAVPGEGLLRCACDLMTGSAGILRVLHRLNHGGSADFLLDEAVL
jgi:Lanthionine synthetase C-like protein